ncbi:MAG TPA: TetR family transcriptional regulator, partial [Cupriavidus sp.]|nr:TetR family transcriptional regulator [Cupriavidus sp.]
MSKLTRDHWVSAGLESLDQEGHAGVSAEILARRLNVTRGSFYHHFRNREDFVRTLLAKWEEDYTERMLAYAAQGRTARETLMRYLSIAAEKQPGREVAIRAWALHDPLVAEFQQRVDATRLAFAVRMCRRWVRSPSHAELIGQAAHLCLIGGQQAGLRRDASRFNK